MAAARAELQRACPEPGRGAFPELSRGAESSGDTPPLEAAPVALDKDQDIFPAVATYTIDHSGAMVEVHSPRTEVPRLGPPKS